MFFLGALALAAVVAVTVGPICLFGNWFLNKEPSFPLWMVGILGFTAAWVGVVGQVLFWIGVF